MGVAVSEHMRYVFGVREGEGVGVYPGREGPAGHAEEQKGFRQEKAVPFALRTRELWNGGWGEVWERRGWAQGLVPMSFAAIQVSSMREEGRPWQWEKRGDSITG